MGDMKTSAATGDSCEESPSAANSESFCIRLWHHLRVEADGEARVCCAYHGENIAQGDVPMSANRQSLMEIWNSDTMRELRRDMVEGRRVAGCRQCYADEARGGVSMRLRDNAAWKQGWLNEERATIDEVAASAVENDFRLPGLPALIEVETGNLCNFKCRMCNGSLSSLIAKDPVHQSWAEDQASAYHDQNAQRGPYKFRPAGAISSLGAQLVKDTKGQIRRLYFIGGEPLLVREVRDLVERLVAAGRAQQVELSFVSNGSLVPEWLSMAAQFRRVDLAVSVDGYVDHYDYIRYPGRWSDLAKHLQLLKNIPNVHLRVTSTIQVNNALNITRLFRYLDYAEIDFTGYLLHWPRYLAVGMLPSAVRRVAGSRLTEYAEGDCRPENRALILSLAAQFDAGGDLVDVGLLRDFMLFTNDLDTSRGQSIHRTDPELVELLAEAGFPWLDETLHASPVTGTQEAHVWRLALMGAQSATIKLERELVEARATARRTNEAQLELLSQLTLERRRLALSEEQAASAKSELGQLYAS
jgi:MoaA/NifB/PqqE/SkfB family radical SAM enzyme